MACRHPLNLLAVLALAAPLPAAPWDEPFRASPAELMAATADLPTRPGDGVAILLEDGRFSYDDQGRMTRTFRLVYRTLDDAGVDGWGSMSAPYEPWRSAAPTLRARVIAPDGSVRELDPATIDEAPTHDDLPDVLTSGRVLRAPLPGLAPGCVVEHEITWADVAPLLPGSGGGMWRFGFNVPTAESRVSIDAPAGLEVKFVPRLLDQPPERVERDGRVVTTWRRVAVPRREAALDLLPPDVPRSSRVAWTTSRSWAEIAEAYAAIVDRQARIDEVAESARAAAGNAKEPLVAASRCLAWIHERVRYTGLEFGEAAIVPVRPSECLARGYGDCKDKATLLVAMLRALGHRADVALLMPGYGEDVDADVPSLGNFTHAIAAVGDPPVFIDATAPQAAVGELPDADRGRLALVARTGVTALLRTPRTSPATDRVLEVVDVEMAEDGSGKLSETTSSWGRFAIEHRSIAASQTAKDLQEALDDWCASEWLATSAFDIESSPASDMTAPTRLRYAVRESKRVVTSWPAAGMGLPPGGWLRPLAFLVEEEDETPDEEERLRREREAARTQAALLPTAFAWERRYRIVPPPGYEIDQLPTMEGWRIGPVSFAGDATAGDDGVVTVSFRFDTGDGRLEPSELAALRKRLADLASQDLESLHFRSVAFRLLEEGEVKAALGELRRLRDLHPSEALHRIHLSAVLMEVGLGDAARRAAADAVAAEASSGAAHAAVAASLVRDAFGRLHGEGSDRAGALAALRRARELAPKDEAIRRELAALLGITDDGATDWDPRTSALSAAEWASLESDLGVEDPEVRTERAAALLRAGDPAGATAAVLDWKGERSLRLDAVGLAAIAMASGAAEAVRRSSTVPFREHDRSELLEGVAGILLQARRYPEAADALSAAAKGSARAAEIAGRADMLRGLVLRSGPQSPPDDPRNVVERLILATLTGDEAAAAALFSRSVMGGAAPDGEAVDLAPGLRLARLRLASADLSAGAMADMFLGLARMAVDTDGSDGARVLVRAPSPRGEVTAAYFLRREEGSWRVVGAEGAAAHGAIAFEHALAGRHEVARRWLDWAHPLPVPGGADLTFGETWKPGQEAGPEQIRLAAAMLSFAPDPGGEVTRELLAARERAESDEQRSRIDLALVQRHRLNRKLEDALVVARQIAARESGVAPGVRHVITLLRELGRPAEAVALLEGLAARRPEDDLLQEALASELSIASRTTEALAVMRALEAKGKGGPGLANNIAWHALMAGEPAASVLPQARAAASDGSVGALNTLAAVLAEADRPLEARQVLLQGIDGRGGDTSPREADWYVIGRIAEGYGEIEAARAAYERALAADLSTPEMTGVETLVRRRVAALGAPPAAVAGAAR